MADFESGQNPFAAGGDSIPAGQNPFEGGGDFSSGQNPFKKPMRGEGSVSTGETPTYSGAIGTGFVQGMVQGAGGGLEAAGDVLAPREETWTDIGERIRNRVGTALSSGGSMPVAMSVALEEAAGGLRRKLTRAVVNPEGDVAEVGKNLSGWGAEMGDTAREKISAATPKDLNMLQEAGISVATSAGQMAPWLVANRLGLRPGLTQAGALGTMGAQSFGQTYNEAKAKGADPDVAFKAALASGGAEVIGEKLGLDTLLKGGSGWFKKYLMQEVGGEEFTTIAQSLTEKGLYDPTKWSSPEEVMHDLAVTGLAAAGGAGAIKGLDKGMDYVVGKRAETKYDAESAQKELADIEAKAQLAFQGFPEEIQDAEPPPPKLLSPLTPQEEMDASLQEEQLKKGLSVEPGKEQLAYANRISQAWDEQYNQPLMEKALAEDVGGMTENVLERRGETFTPHMPLGDMQVVGSGTDQNILGLTLKQVGEVQPGSVLMLGKPEAAVSEEEGAHDLFPMEVYSKVLEDLQTWVRKYMPDARMLVNLQQLAGGQFGAHMPVVGDDGTITHIITPRELPGYKYKGGDVKTNMAMVTALTHEFGHALKTQNLLQGVQGLGAKGVQQLQNALARGVVSPTMMKAVMAVAPTEGAMIARWQDLRTKTLNGELTAKEFVEQWVGMRKLGDSVNPNRAARNKSLYSWAKEKLGESGKTLEGSTALELVEAAYGNPKYALNFDEYMAEQFSRAAYSKGDVEGGALGQFFQRTMTQLRDLFRTLKGEKLISPDTTFEKWLDEQTTRAKGMEQSKGTYKLTKQIKAEQKRILKEKGFEPKVEKKARAKKAKPPEQVPVPLETKATQVDEKGELEAIASELFTTGKITEAQYDRYADKIERGELPAVRNSLQRLMADEINFDREYTSKVLQRLPNKEKLKSETLRATIAMQDVKERERAAWEAFLVQHPQGFTRADAEAMLVENMMPLENSFSSDYASHGRRVVDQSLDTLLPEGAFTSVIWRNPTMQSDARNHFRDPSYVMHSRRADVPGVGRYVLELQSDFFQKGGTAEGAVPQEYTDELDEVKSGVNFYSDQLEYFRELIASGDLATAQYEWRETRHIFGDKYRNMPLNSLEELSVLMPELTTLEEENQARFEQLQGMQEVFQNRSERVMGQLEVLGKGWWERLIQEEVAEASEDGQPKVWFPTADTMASVEGWDPEDQPGIYARYKNDVTKYLKKRYGAVEVEQNGVDWLEVELNDKSGVILNWDKENPYQPTSPAWTLDEVAGLSQEQMRDPATVAEAKGLWARLGFESPFFKRWGGNTKVVGLDGTPLRLFRGTGSKVNFLNKDSRGGLTGAPSARKAFWFSDNHANAQWYANKAADSKYRPLAENYRREAAKLQRQINEAIALRDELRQGSQERSVVTVRIERLRASLTALRADKKKTIPAQPVVQSYFLNMENPLVVDMGGMPYDDAVFTKHLDTAAATGYDGVIFKNTYDPLGGNIYAVFEPEQAKAVANMGTFDRTDELHWDAESTGQQAARATSKLLQKFWGKEKLTALNMYTKGVDMMTQLQQTIAMQPDAYNLQTFAKKYTRAMRLKNNLLTPAEELVKSMAQVQGQSQERVKKLHSLMKAEWKTGQLQTTIKGYDYTGEEVWSEEMGMGLEQQAQVERWEVQDTMQLRAFMKEQGVDVTTEEGKAILDMYLQTRNMFLFQFQEMSVAFRSRAASIYSNAPALQKRELSQINAVMSALMFSPFVPQGNFGKYVLVVKQAQPTGRKKVIFRKHYENKAEFDIATAEAQKRAGSGLGLEVTTKELEDQVGIPMHLPNDMLERIGHLGVYDDEALLDLADIMSTTRYNRVQDKFERMSEQVEGGNEDFVRVLADFGLRNANFIWKTRYRSELQRSISAEKYARTRLEKNTILPLEQKLAEISRMSRNISQMQDGLNYVMNPPAELQAMRSAITLMYLAGNIKTAAMNLFTIQNTAAAVTSEYGEVQGLKEFTKSFAQMKDLFFFNSSRKKAIAEGKAIPTTDDAVLNELVGVLDKAIQDGVVDQSYAYYLAAHADSSPLLSATKGKMNSLAHQIAEWGMMPFQATEKINRIHTLITFYKLERSRFRTDPTRAYDIAVEKTNQLQNAYDQMNRPKLLRGKMAPFTMFMSYTLWMGNVMLGGYERGARAQARSMGREVTPIYRGTTAKLWLMYLMLGGLMGLPFARDMLDVVQWLWRKLGLGNAEAELRDFIQDLGLDSNFVMHGRLHNLAGFDLSGSYGMGNMLPGTDLLVKEGKMDITSLFGSLLMAGSGPAGSFYKSVGESIGHLTEDPTTMNGWLNAGKSLPGAAGSIAKAMDAGIRQMYTPTAGITTKKGTRMTWDKERGEFRDVTTYELAGMLLGANPAFISENREKHYAEMNEVLYWQTRRSDLMDRYWQAVRSGDEDLRKAVLKAHEDFNSQAPSPGLKITGKVRADSVKSYRVAVRAEEKFGTAQKKYRGVVKEVGEGY